MSTNSEHLQWCRDRLAIHHDDGENVDFIVRLDKIIAWVKEIEGGAQVYVNGGVHARVDLKTVRDPQGTISFYEGGALVMKRFPDGNTQDWVGGVYESTQTGEERKEGMTIIEIAENHAGRRFRRPCWREVWGSFLGTALLGVTMDIPNLIANDWEYETFPISFTEAVRKLSGDITKRAWRRGWAKDTRIACNCAGEIGTSSGGRFVFRVDDLFATDWEVL